MLALCTACGGTRAVDEGGEIFTVSPEGISSLHGTWKVRAGDSPGFAARDCDDRAWDTVRVPGNLMSLYPAHTGKAWYRTRLAFEKRPDAPFALILGRISDADEAWFNGVRIGGTGSVDDATRHGFDRTRVYHVPASLIAPGSDNVLAVRVRGYLHDSAGLIWGDYGAGPLGEVQRYVFRDLASDVLFMGIYSFMAVFFLIFSIMKSPFAAAQRAFALVSLAFAIYIYCAGQVKYLFTDHFFGFHLVQYQVGIAGTILMLMLFRRLLGRGIGKSDWFGMGMLGCAAASLFFIPEIRDWTIPRLAWNAAVLYVAGLGLVHVAVSIWRRRWDLLYVDLGFAVISMAGLFEVLRANNVAPDFDYTRFGLAGLMICIAFFLTDQLNVIRQIEARAIAELEEKVRARTHELSERNDAIERQLEIARLIQSKLMPGEPPRVAGFSAYAVYIPMDKVGGDFYDYHDGARSIRGIVADVSGHGVPGAFLALITKMAFQSFAPTAVTNAGLLEVLNRYIFQSTVLSHFVTACVYTIDKETNELRYASAGHVAPVLYRRTSGTCEELYSRGKPLGWLQAFSVEEKSAKLSPGDRILFYTDGVTECRTAAGEFFGSARLEAFVRDSADLMAQECSRALMRMLREFSGRDEFEDDITYVIVDILRPAQPLSS